MLNNIISNYSFMTIFKIIFILMILTIGIGLIYLESKIKIEPKLPEYKSAGILGDNVIKNLKLAATTALGLSTIYGTTITAKNE